MTGNLFLDGSIWNYSSATWSKFQDYCRLNNIDASCIHTDEDWDTIIKEPWKHWKVIEALVDFRRQDK